RVHTHQIRRSSMKSVIISRTLQSLAPRARIARVIVAVAFAGLFTAACKGTTDFRPVTSLTISPTSATVPVNGTQQFTVVAKDADGRVLSVTPTWSLVAGGGTLSSTGLFTAGTTTGTFTNTVRVTCSGITATATVIVGPGALLTITVTPNPATLATGATQQFTAVGKDANGNVVAITPVWSTVNPPGSINATGLFTAGNTAGTFPNTVRATQGAIFGTATVVVTAAVVPIVNLGTANNFAILAGAGIRCAISGTVTGATSPADIGSSPTLTISGFPPCTFDGSIPLPAVVATAKGDLTAAYLAAQGQVCNRDLTGLDLGFFDGSTPTKTLPAGTYCFSTSAGLTGTLLLTGSATAKWTFQIGSTLIAEVGSRVVLAGGAIPNNVNWAVGTSATLRTNTAFQGNIMTLQSITLESGVILLGRALAQVGAVDLIAGTVVITKP
ncbi:MAG TPA: ice-binding family protein, partial [Gemmatimonadaceae bacterium]|nr:ice-binding family protein [Gemmatimonadaceae bacterium]